MTAETPTGFGQYARAIVALAEHEVDFVICGGVASVLHGVPRVTADLDVLVRMTDENLRRLVAAILALELQPRAPVPLDAICDRNQREQWITDKGAKVMTFVSQNSPLQIDVLLEYPLDFETVYEHARHGRIEDVTFRISSIEHLIHVKQAIRPPRQNDQFDLQYLQRLLNDESE